MLTDGQKNMFFLYYIDISKFICLVFILFLIKVSSFVGYFFYFCKK